MTAGGGDEQQRKEVSHLVHLVFRTQYGLALSCEAERRNLDGITGIAP